MYFKQSTPLHEILNWVTQQYIRLVDFAKDGIEIDIKKRKKQRTIQQNRFFMAILVALVRFYNETGFMPDGCKPWMMRTDILKEYWKYRYGVKSTSRLSTAEFGKLCDFTQNTLVQETEGEWEVLEPDSAYLQSLIEQGGI